MVQFGESVQGCFADGRSVPRRKKIAQQVDVFPLLGWSSTEQGNGGKSCAFISLVVSGDCPNLGENGFESSNASLGSLGQPLVKLVERFVPLLDSVDEAVHENELSSKILFGSNFVEHFGKGFQVVL